VAGGIQWDRHCDRALPALEAPSDMSQHDLRVANFGIVTLIVFVLWNCAGCLPPTAPVPCEFQADVGPIITTYAGVPVERDFEFVNPSGDVPIRLKLLTRSCGCLSHVEEPAEISPGKTGQIKLSTHVPFGSRDHEYFALYETGIIEAPRLTFRLNVHAVADVSVEPAEFSTFTLSRRATKEFRFRVAFARYADEEAPPTMISSIGDELAIREIGRAERQVDNVILTDLAYEGQLTHPKQDQTQSSGRATIVASFGESVVRRDVPWRWSSAVTATPEKLFVRPVQLVPVPYLGIVVPRRATMGDDADDPSAAFRNAAGLDLVHGTPLSAGGKFQTLAQLDHEST